MADQTQDTKQDEAPKTVTMESIQWHTYDGKDHPVGDTYELPVDLVDSVTAQGKAVRVDRVEHAKRQADDAEKARQAKSAPVEPMTTENVGRTKAK